MTEVGLEQGLGNRDVGLSKVKLAEQEVSRLESSLSARAPELERLLDAARAAAAASDVENKLLRAELSQIKVSVADASTEDASKELRHAPPGRLMTPLTPDPEKVASPRAGLAAAAVSSASTPASLARSGGGGGGGTGSSGSAMSPSIEDAFNDQSVEQMMFLMQEKADLSRKNAALERENRLLENRLKLVEMEMVDAMQRCAAAESSQERLERAESVRVVELELEMARIKVELAESVYERERLEHESRRAMRAREKEKEEWLKVSAEDV